MTARTYFMYFRLLIESVDFQIICITYHWSIHWPFYPIHSYLSAAKVHSQKLLTWIIAVQFRLYCAVPKKKKKNHNGNSRKFIIAHFCLNSLLRSKNKVCRAFSHLVLHLPHFVHDISWLLLHTPCLITAWLLNRKNFWLICML